MTTDTHVTSIAVLGAAGRMGRAIVRIVAETPGAALTAAVDQAGNPFAGQDAGQVAGVTPTGVVISRQLPVAGAAAVWIDFSSPAATVANAAAAAQQGAALIDSVSVSVTINPNAPFALTYTEAPADTVAGISIKSASSS